MRVTVRQIMEPADDAEEGAPPPMREQALLLSRGDDEGDDEGEGKNQDEGKDGEEVDGEGDDTGAGDGGEEKDGGGEEKDSGEGKDGEEEKENADEDKGEDEGEAEAPPTPAEVAGDAFDALDPAAAALQAGESLSESVSVKNERKS